MLGEFIETSAEIQQKLVNQKDVSELIHLYGDLEIEEGLRLKEILKQS